MMTKLPIALALLLGSVFYSSAQSKYRAVVDPAYSPNNYKHNNKAVAARKEKAQLILMTSAYNYTLMKELWTPRKPHTYKTVVAGYSTNSLVVVQYGKVENNTNPFYDKHHYKKINFIGPTIHQSESGRLLEGNTLEKEPSPLDAE